MNFVTLMTKGNLQMWLVKGLEIGRLFWIIWVGPYKREARGPKSEKNVIVEVEVRAKDGGKKERNREKGWEAETETYRD